MKAIILGAGYATRLYPLTKNFPKPLLKIGSTTIIDHIMEKIDRVKEIDKVYVVTNHNFYNHFSEWQQKANYSKEIVIVDDNTTSNENRLGAVKDLYYTVEKENIEDEVLVLAGDNLFDFELTDMVSFYRKKDGNVISTHKLPKIEDLRRTGVISLNEEGLVTEFEEKPVNPKSEYAVPPFYIYRMETITRHLKDYVNNPIYADKLDAPGNFIPYLIEKDKVYAYKFAGSRYDIGTIESYNLVKEMFENR